VLKIGVLLPYTESSIGVDIGLDQKRAADLYLKQHAGKLGGRPVSLVYSAESIEAGINKTKVKTLLDTEHVGLLMGAANPDTGQIMRDAAEAARMVYIDTHATTNRLSGSKYVFRTSASNWQLSEPFGEWAGRNAGGAFYLCGVDDVFGAEVLDAFAAGLTTGGGSLSGRMAVSSGGDWARVVASIFGQPARNVFAALQTDDAEGFLAQWHAQGAASAGNALYGPGMLTDEEVLASSAGSASSGVTTSLFWSPDVDTAENKMLVDAFPNEYTDDDTGERVSLNGYAVEMWDAMTALDRALEQTAGTSSDADALIAALEAVEFKSPRGMFAFDKSTHDPVQDIYVRRVVRSDAGKPANRVVAKIASAAVTLNSR
jgi:branched-chain amino acid transport system substrate-binding protein